MSLADLVLDIHFGIILFNVFGLVAVPLGGWLDWRFVRIFWWRALHVASWAVVAIQAVAGRACFLTLWQAALSGEQGGEPLVRQWIGKLIYWKLPLWVFAVGYCLVLVYTLALWRLVPAKRRKEPTR